MNYDVHLLLGCWGLQQDSFILCGGVENTILSIGLSTPQYQELMDYFDNLRLFDRPLFEWNAILNVIYNLENKFSQVTKPTFLPKQKERIQKYLQQHRSCGVYLKLALADDLQIPTVSVKEEKDREIFVQGRRTLKLVRKPA